ncbi:MAG: Ig-like domain-containing protein [bacterium]
MQHTAKKTNTGQALAAVVLLAGAALLSVATSSSPPVIDRITPGLGASAVAVDRPLELELEQPLDPATVTDETVRLRRSHDGELVPVALTLSESNHRLTIQPSAPLDPYTDYELELDLARIASADGEAYAGVRYDESLATVWETSGLLLVPFTTKNTLKVARAFVTQDPRELLVYFSQLVDPELLTREAISLESSKGSVSIDLRYNAQENRLRIIPLAPLDDRTTYTLSLGADIASMDGARLNAGHGEQLTFTPGEERIR